MTDGELRLGVNGTFLTASVEMLAYQSQVMKPELNPPLITWLPLGGGGGGVYFVSGSAGIRAGIDVVVSRDECPQGLAWWYVLADELCGGFHRQVRCA